MWPEAMLLMQYDADFGVAEDGLCWVEFTFNGTRYRRTDKNARSLLASALVEIHAAMMQEPTS